MGAHNPLHRAARARISGIGMFGNSPVSIGIYHRDEHDGIKEASGTRPHREKKEAMTLKNRL